MINYFTDEELSCKCCNENKFNPRTIDRLNALRDFCGFPFVISSAYRCEAYNKLKGYTQTHATGQAVDIATSHKKAYDIITNAEQFGFTGIGINQKGKGRFIHLDDLTELSNRPRPHIWSY